MSVKANATITLIRVNDGTNGKDGTSVKITAKSVTYQASTSGTTTPTGTWLANPPVVAKGQYLWTKTVVTYSDGNSTTAYSVAYQGTNGANGQNGSPGRGVKSAEVTYQIWKDGTSTPNGTWSSTPPKTTADNPYLWTRTVITYTDDTKSTSYSVGSTPEGIVVGGRNFLLKSKDCNDTNYYYAINYVNSGSQFKNCNIFKTSSAWTGIKPWFTKNVTDRDVVKAGDVLTYSIYARTDSAEEMHIFLFNRRQDSNAENRDLDTSIFTLTSEWQRYSATFTVTEGMLSKETGITYFGFEIGQATEDGKFVYFSCPKLELGNIATDWTPAPEDVDEGINNAQSSADKANSSANDAQASANNALQAASNASSKADKAQSSADNAVNASQQATQKAKEAQDKANSASNLATNALNDVNNISQVVKIDSQGVRILESVNSNNYVHHRSDGSHFYTNGSEDGLIGPDSKINNLAVKDFFMRGAHREELAIVLGQQATVCYWIGDIV